MIGRACEGNLPARVLASRTSQRGLLAERHLPGEGQPQYLSRAMTTLEGKFLARRISYQNGVQGTSSCH
jgi:hypothetical protein